MHLAHKHSACIQCYFYCCPDPQLPHKTPYNIPEPTFDAEAGWGHAWLATFSSVPLPFPQVTVIWCLSHKEGWPGPNAACLILNGLLSSDFQAGSACWRWWGGLMGKLAPPPSGNCTFQGFLGTHLLNTPECDASQQLTVVKPPPQLLRRKKGICKGNPFLAL